MIEKEFNDGIYTKSTAKREKCTRFMLHNMIFRANRWEYFTLVSLFTVRGSLRLPLTNHHAKGEIHGAADFPDWFTGMGMGGHLSKLCYFAVGAGSARPDACT